ncbi:hypothetical protein EJ02DRAFT_459616 [Clathrospora elynae]|uniref:Uncharacterized protein n=1 Tax=Clathrospora elynae TaxID=706981 RepID=A0A6A5S9X5_9PLEO|nr:hypothetical protein EJ02DRAFT_459616 [Clathrospora elynae]
MSANESQSTQTNGPETLTQPSTSRNLVQAPGTAACGPAIPNSAAATTAPPNLPILIWNYTEDDFKDIFATWGRYSTPELVISSPFYTKTVVMTDPAARRKFSENKDILTREVHAVHPVPREELQDMGPNCLHHLGEQLEEERWYLDRDPAFNARLKETLARIDDALEFVFRVQFPGSRLFSSRGPTEL